MDVFATRIGPGEDLRLALERLTLEQGWQAAFILSAVGSLDRACLRYAGRDEENMLDGEMEIVALAGTLCPDGVHLHVCVADHDGRVTGGHLLAGCRVRTTIELVVGRTKEFRFRRRIDPRTGFRELEVSGR